MEDSGPNPLLPSTVRGEEDPKLKKRELGGQARWASGFSQTSVSLYSHKVETQWRAEVPLPYLSPKLHFQLADEHPAGKPLQYLQNSTCSRFKFFKPNPKMNQPFLASLLPRI